MPIAGQWRPPTDWTPSLTGIDGPWQDNVSTIPASVINGILSNQIALHALAGSGFDLHEDVTTELGTLATQDRFLVSDESAAGAPNRWIGAGDLPAWIRRNGGLLDIRRDIVAKVTTPSSEDRMIITDESTQGDPTRYITLDQLADFIRRSGGGGMLQTKAARTAGTGDGIVLRDHDNVEDPTEILSVTITPASTSNLVMIDYAYDVLWSPVRSATSSVSAAEIFLFRTIGNTTTRLIYHKPLSSPGDSWYSGRFYDAPASTSAVTYKLRGFSPDETGPGSNSCFISPGASMAAHEILG